jgi:hypothetical protein
MPVRRPPRGTACCGVEPRGAQSRVDNAIALGATGHTPFRRNRTTSLPERRLAGAQLTVDELASRWWRRRPADVELRHDVLSADRPDDGDPLNDRPIPIGNHRHLPMTIHNASP